MTEKIIKYIPLYNDIMFHAIFGSLDSIKFVTYFLASYFNKTYDELKDNVEILNPIVPTKLIEAKGKTLDLKAQMDNSYILIEMNCFNKNISKNRNLTYLMQDFTYQFKKNAKYTEIKNYHQINFCKYSYFKPTTEISRVKLRDQFGNIYLEEMTSDFINIDYCKKKMYNKSNLDTLDTWIMILTAETEEELRLAIERNEDVMDKNTKEEFLDMILDLDKMEEIHEYFENEDKSDWFEQEHEYLLKEERKKALAEGELKGEIKGENKSKLNIAKNMLKKKLDIDLIHDITGLPIKEIENLM